MSRKSLDLHLKIPLIDGRNEATIVPASTPKIIVQSPSTEQFPFFDHDRSPTVENGGFELPRKPEDDHIAKEEEFEAYDKFDGFDMEPTQATRSSGLRRNSISLPAGLNEIDLEMLRQQHIDHPANISEPNEGSGSTSYSDGRNDSGEDINDVPPQEKSVKKPFQNARKKSVMASLAARSKDEDTSTINSSEDEYSHVNSVTSINSLASLLKEKIQSIPSKIKKKPTDYKIRAFVGFLFLCIVFLVGFAYIMYHQQVLARAYFFNIKFNKKDRIIKIANVHGNEVLFGQLGYFLGKSTAFDCMESNTTDGSVCFEWLEGLRLHMNKINLENENLEDIRCYSIKWQALVSGVSPMDCFELGVSPENHWYGGGQAANMSWPFGKSSHNFSPLITGNLRTHQWGNALARYFISSRGVAILIDEKTPLHVSINMKNDRKLCLKAMHDDFAYANRFTSYPELNYKICTSRNIKDLYSSLSHQSLWDGLKEDEVTRMNALVTEPVWHIASRNKEEFTESMVYNYTEDVIALGFLKQGHVLINEHWQKYSGDFELDLSRFESLADTVNIIHRRGFKIVFSIQPFISTESHNFAECVQKRLLIAQRNGDMNIPSLTKYKSAPTVGVLDITSNRTIPWLLDRLKNVINKYKIDGFFIDFGLAYNMPHYYQCEKPLTNPDEYKTIFTNNMKSLINIIGVTSAISLPKPPIFLALPPLESSWEAIRQVIPTILSYGVIGYPFLMPGAVGGDTDWIENNLEYDATKAIGKESRLPEKELYLRWLQLATFLPVIKFTHLPSKYNDDQVLEVAKVLTDLRQTTVSPLIIKYLRQALDTGLPIIRPLWMLEPQDTACLDADDEFSIGEELIVAPILVQGSNNREVYLPSGVWKDGINGALRKGSRWLHDYHVPTDKVAYFLKMPDNTRF